MGFDGPQNARTHRISRVSEPLLHFPNVMLHEEFDSIESCLKFIKSKEYFTHIAEVRALGVTNLSVQMWEAAPDYPMPLKPSKG